MKLGVAYSAMGLVCTVAACEPPQGPVTEADVAIYAGEQAACVAQAASLDAGKACLDAVRASRCGPQGSWLDAGVCGMVTGEGGAP